jgi:hypothetical protein
MNKRTFLKVCMAIGGTALAPSVAAARPVSTDEVSWYTELFDYGMAIGIAGCIGTGMDTIRAGIRIPFWNRLSFEQRERCTVAAKLYIRHWLATKKNIVLGDRMLEGNEISVDVTKLLESVAAYKVSAR